MVGPLGRALAKLAQMDALDSELRRLRAENRPLSERLDSDREVQLHREAQEQWQAQRAELQEALKGREEEGRELRGRVEQAERGLVEEREKVEKVEKERKSLGKSIVDILNLWGLANEN